MEMALYDRLIELKNELGEKALRAPKTKKETAIRKKWERVMTILLRRYNYGMEEAEDDMRFQDHLDEIASIKRF